MKYTWILILFLSSFFSGFAQDAVNVFPDTSRLNEYMGPGMEVTGLRIPYYNDEGYLKALFYGGHAKILEYGVAEVHRLRIQIFRDKNVFMSVFVPRCFTKIGEKDGKQSLLVYSDGDVLVEMEQMTISGRGLLFTSEQNRVKILYDCKVLVKKNVRDMVDM